MNKVVLMGVIATLATSATARASDSWDHGRRLFQYDFKCSFDDRDSQGVDTDTVSPVPTDNRRERCNASARVFAFARERDRDGLANIEMARDRFNLLTVSCDNRLIYADSAILESRLRYVEIEAPSGLPAILVLRNDDDHGPGMSSGSIDDGGMKFRANLRLREDRLRGECEVRRRRLDDSEVSSPLN